MKNKKISIILIIILAVLAGTGLFAQRQISKKAEESGVLIPNKSTKILTIVPETNLSAKDRIYAILEYPINNEIPQIKIEPNIKGSWKVYNPTTIIFSPAEDYVENTKYSISLVNQNNTFSVETKSNEPEENIEKIMEEIKITESETINSTESKEENEQTALENTEKNLYIKTQNINTQKIEFQTSNISEVEIKICKASLQSITKLYENTTCEKIESKIIQVEYQPEEKTKTTSITVSQIAKENLPYGIYNISIQDISKKDGAKTHNIYIYSDISLMSKTFQTGILVWATNKQSGTNQKDISLNFIDAAGNKIFEGVTDTQGLYYNAKNTKPISYIIATKENDSTMLDMEWNTNMRHEVFGMASDWNNQKFLGTVTTDKKNYKNEEEIIVMGSIRKYEDDKLSVPTNQKIRMSIYDPLFKKVYESEITMNEATFLETIEMKKLKTTDGEYNLNICIGEKSENDCMGDEFYNTFGVGETPIFIGEIDNDFSVKILNEKNIINKGEKLEIPIQVISNNDSLLEQQFTLLLRDSFGNQTQRKLITTNKMGRGQTDIFINNKGLYNFEIGEKVRPIYVKDSSAERMESENTLLLIPEKNSYAAGERAKILVVGMKNEITDALITKERKGVMEYRLEEIKKDNPYIYMDVAENDTPNIYVGIVTTDSKTGYDFAYQKLEIQKEKKEMNISVKGIQTKYSPGEKIFAEITTMVEDKKVPAKIIAQINPVHAKTRTQELNEEMEVAFNKTRGLGVFGASNENISTKNIKPDTNQNNYIFNEPNKAEAFTTDYATTNNERIAKMEINLPENIKEEFILSIFAISESGETNVQNYNIRTTDDIDVSVFSPDYIRAQDKVYLETILTNNSNENKTITVNIESIESSIEGQNEKKIFLPKKETVKTFFKIIGKNSEKQIIEKITISAIDGMKVYKIQKTIPIINNVQESTVGLAGKISKNKETIKLPPEMINEDHGGEIKFFIGNNISTFILSYVENLLTQRQNGNNETLISKIVPIVIAYKKLQLDDFQKLDLPELKNSQGNSINFESIIENILSIIYKEQKSDGGWSLWQQDNESETVTTAYILNSLNILEKNKIKVSEQIQIGAFDFLIKKLYTEKEIDNKNSETMYALYVLSQIGRNDPKSTQKFYEEKSTLGFTEKIYLALALSNDNQTTKAKEIFQELINDDITYETAKNSIQNSKGTVIAHFILLSQKLSAEESIKTKMINTIIQSDVQKLSTSDKANIIEAIMNEYKNKNDDKKQLITILINGNVINEGEMGIDTMLHALRFFFPMERLLALSKDAEISFAQKDSTDIYYNIRAIWPKNKKTTSVSHGAVIIREYNNDVIQGEKIIENITVVAPTDLWNVVMEEPMPAGLKTENIIVKEQNMFVDATNANTLSLHAKYLPKGVYRYTIEYTAKYAGEYTHPAATIQEWYNKETYGRSDDAILVIKPKSPNDDTL